MENEYKYTFKKSLIQNVLSSSGRMLSFAMGAIFCISIYFIGNFIIVGLLAGGVSWIFGADDPRSYALLWGYIGGGVGGFIGFVVYVIALNE